MSQLEAAENNRFFGIDVQVPLTEEAIKQVAQQNIIFIQQYWEKMEQNKEDNPTKILYIEESEIERCRFLKFIKDHSATATINGHFSHIYWHSLHHYAVNGLEPNIKKDETPSNNDLIETPFYQNIWFVRMLEIAGIIGIITIMNYFTKQ